MNAWLTSARLARRDLTRHRWRSLAAVLLFALPVMAVLVFAGAVFSDRTNQGTDPTAPYADVWIGQSPCPDTAEHCEAPDAATVALPDRQRMAENLGTDPDDPIATLDTEARISTPGGTSFDRTATALPDTVTGAPEPGSFMARENTARGLGLKPGDTATVTVLDSDGDEHALELTYTGPSPSGTFLSLADVPGSRIIDDPDFTGIPETSPWQVSYLIPPELTDTITDGLDTERADRNGVHISDRTTQSGQPAPIARDVLRGLTSDSALLNWTLLTFALLVVIAVVTPIFAVAARRQTRLTGLLSATGAAPTHLRRVLLIQGLMIGAVGAVLGSVLSIPVERVLVGAVDPGVEVHWPWDLALLVIVTSLIVGVGSSLLPALQTGRQDPVVALRGGRSIRIRRFSRPMIIGPVIMLIATWWSVATDSPFTHALTQPLLGLGLVLSAPLLLWGTAAVAARFPLPGRLASRDALRSMTRTAPAVGAIAGITFVSTTFLSILWLPTTVYEGENRLPDDAALFTTTGAIHLTPDTAHERIDGILERPRTGRSDIFIPEPGRWNSTDWKGLAATGSTTADEEFYLDAPLFQGWNAHGLPDVHEKILINDGSAVTALEGLTDRQRAAIHTALDKGEIVVTDPDLAVDGDAGFGRERRRGPASPEHAAQTVDTDGFAVAPAHRGDTATEEPRDHEVLTHPVTVIPLDGPGVWLLTPETAAEIGMGTTYAGTLVRTLEPVSTLDSFRMDTKVNRDQPLRVDTANKPPYELLTWMLPLLIACLISYGIVVLLMLLTAAESRRDTDVLTAVGGSPRLLARYVGAQGLIIGLGGAVAGTLAAFVPFLAELLSGDRDGFLQQVFHQVDTVQRSTSLLATLVGVPLLAWATGLAIGAWIAGHRRPLSDRRE
ncbi:ABC transporter permease [Corynebacterium pygosceleis]|uniref:ABC transporter permease n=1 Tax=Corynebacterium pygosceleis TaxID=2800406 RepID=UPI002005BD8F|nr:FtsX-like permease family protein [Corynebacterium pygosceleis]MCK7675941.1 FtsX-like permease family protein [Corynebacterium pygosceleis]